MLQVEQGACAPSTLFGGAVVCVHRRQASPSNQLATVQTVERMCELVLMSRDGPATRATAAGLGEQSRRPSSISACGSALGRSGESTRSVRRCAAVWWWLRGIRFVHDQELLGRLLNLGDELELLIQPELLFRLDQPFGDCDDFTMAACALLLNLGLESEIVTLAADPVEPRRWSHVFAQAVLPCGRRFALDATPHAEYPGWVVPAWRINRVQEWALDGSPIETGAYRRVHVRRSRAN